MPRAEVVFANQKVAAYKAKADAAMAAVKDRAAKAAAASEAKLAKAVKAAADKAAKREKALLDTVAKAYKACDAVRATLSDTSKDAVKQNGKAVGQLDKVAHLLSQHVAKS